MLIEFTFNPKLLCILVFPIFKELERFISGQILKDKDHNLFKIFRILLSNQFSIIFLLIFKCKNKSQKKDISQEETPEKDNENEEKDERTSSAITMAETEIKRSNKKKKIKSILFLCLLSILYFCSYFYNYYVRNSIFRLCRNSIGIIFEIIILYLLSFFILKAKYYKHHYFSISVILITLIVLFILYLKQVNDSEYSIYNSIWYYFVYYCLYGSFNILIKKYLSVYYYSLYFILLIMSTFSCFLMLFYDIVAFFANRKLSGIIVSFAENLNSVGSVFLFIVDLLFLFISNLGMFWTIYYFTPFHLIIVEFISELINYYIKLIQYKQGQVIDNGKYDFIFNTNNIALFSVIFLINLICSLIFNEIFILKFCKLEYNTKKYIKERAENDISSIFVENISVNSSNDN